MNPIQIIIKACSINHDDSSIICILDEMPDFCGDVDQSDVFNFLLIRSEMKYSSELKLCNELIEIA